MLKAIEPTQRDGPWRLFWDSHNGNLPVSCLLISREACENGNGIKELFKIFGGLVKDTAGRGLAARDQRVIPGYKNESLSSIKNDLDSCLKGLSFSKLR
jgi:hypothetical protein